MFNTLALNRRLAAAFAVALVAVAMASSMLSTPLAQAAGFRFIRGTSVQNGWMCYGWSNGTYHCTRHWTWRNGHPYSLTSFVPNVSTPPAKPVATSPKPPAPTPAPAPAHGAVYTSRYDGVDYCGAQAVDFSNASQWATPHGCYAHIFYPRSSLGKPGFGFCNWAAEASHTNYGGNSVLRLVKHYNAPRVGAVVWFNPRVQGASSDGHWANLVAIGPHGWGLIEEMNFYYRGGGFGRIDFRFIHLYGGVAYLYA